MSVRSLGIARLLKPHAAYNGISKLPRLLLPLGLLGPSVLLAASQEPQQKSCGLPLITAIHEGDLAKVKTLIHSGVDLNAKDCNGATALTEAIALHGPDEIIEELVLSGASANALGANSESPLMFACWYCREQIVPFLLAHGAEVNAVDGAGYTALMQSGQNCPDGRIAALLILSGAKVNVRAKNGETALNVAAFYGNEHAVHVLVAAGADLALPGHNDQTALRIARDRDVGRKESHDRIYQFLLEASRRCKPGRPVASEGAAVHTLREDHEAEEAKAKALFVEGPVLLLPVSQNFWYTFDWDAVVKLDDRLTFYGGDVKVADQWGMLEASEGVLLVRENGRILRVHVPAPTDAVKMSPVGKGWTLNLKPEWKIVPASRAGDFRVYEQR